MSCLRFFADPATHAAVEIEVVTHGVTDFEALCGDGGDVGGGDPYPNVCREGE